MKPTKSTFFLIISAVLLLVIAACSDEPVVEEESTPAPVAPAPVESAAGSTDPEQGVTILADGVVTESKPVLSLGFATGGRLLTLHVSPGDDVQAGDLIATLDETELEDNVATITLQVAQAEVALAQAEAELDRLESWAADETAVTLAEANVAAAEAALNDALNQDAAAGNSLTSARVSLDQAQRQLTDAREAYDTAFDPGREWELNDPFRKVMLENEREAAVRNLQFAEENLAVAQANYNLAVAGLGGNSALSATANLLSAQQTLEQALQGPTAEEIHAAQLNVQQAEITLQQNQLSLAQAEETLRRAELFAPAAGTVLSVETAVGALVGSGTPVITLLDISSLEFQTTNLSERDLAQITPGLPVEITLKSYPDEPLTGRVSRIGVQATDTVGDAAVFPIIITVPETTLDIRPGMTGRADIQSDN